MILLFATWRHDHCTNPSPSKTTISFSAQSQAPCWENIRGHFLCYTLSSSQISSRTSQPMHLGEIVRLSISGEVPAFQGSLSLQWLACRAKRAIRILPAPIMAPVFVSFCQIEHSNSWLVGRREAVARPTICLDWKYKSGNIQLFHIYLT